MADLTRYVLRRALVAVPTVFLAITLIFLLMVVIPGDFASFIAGSESTPAQQAYLRQYYGLDRPVYVRYVEMLTNLFHGSLGTSFTMQAPVSTVIAQRLPITLILACFSLIIALALALPLGILAAKRRGTKVDTVVSAVSFAGLSIPVFWFGLIVLIIFGAWYHLVPLGRVVDVLDDPLGNLYSFLFPSLVCGITLAASLTRMTRSSMLEVLQQDYIRTARAKGLGEQVVTYKHALSNAVIPILTLTGYIFAGLMAGAIIVEQIFQLPGVGNLMLNAIQTRDNPLVQGTVVVVVLLAILINFIVDVLYAFIDPRIRY